MVSAAQALHIEALIEDEKERILQKYGRYKNDHECYGALKEEIEEAAEELQILQDNLEAFWSRIRSDDVDNLDVFESIELHAIELMLEARQVAAIARKYQTTHLKEWVEKISERV